MGAIKPGECEWDIQLDEHLPPPFKAFVLPLTPPTDAKLLRYWTYMSATARAGGASRCRRVAVFARRRNRADTDPWFVCDMPLPDEVTDEEANTIAQSLLVLAEIRYAEAAAKKGGDT